MRPQIKNRETPSFKKRYALGYKIPDLCFGDFAFSIGKSYNLEFIYLFNFKKSLKAFFKMRKSNQKKVWVFMQKNYPLTKKSKNARMGKGKGMVARYCSRIFHNHNVLEFKGFSLLDLTKLKFIFRQKIGVPVNILSHFFVNKGYRCGAQIEANAGFRKYKQ